MKSFALFALISLGTVALSFDCSAQNASCDEFRSKVPDLATLMKMSKAQRDDLKLFVSAHEVDLKVCLGDRLARLKQFPEK